MRTGVLARAVVFLRGEDGCTQLADLYQSGLGLKRKGGVRRNK